MFLAALLVSCGLFEHPEYNDVMALLEKEFPGDDIVLSSRPKTEGLINEIQYWDVYFEDEPNITFTVRRGRSRIMNGRKLNGEKLFTSVRIDYNSVFTKHYFSSYFGEEQQRYKLRTGIGRELKDREEWDLDEAVLGIAGMDKKDVNEVSESLRGFAGYVEAARHPTKFNLILRFNYPLEDEGDLPCFVQLPASEKEIYEQLNEFAVICQLQNYFALEEAEYKKALGDSCFAVRRLNGEWVEYPELPVNFRGEETSVTIGALYQLAVGEGFEVEGSPEHFWFTGAEGDEYEFSYGIYEDARAYVHNMAFKREYNRKGYYYNPREYYYLKNGEKLLYSRNNIVPEMVLADAAAILNIEAIDIVKRGEGLLEGAQNAPAPIKEAQEEPS